jgi:hypothetical protein
MGNFNAIRDCVNNAVSFGGHVRLQFGSATQLKLCPRDGNLVAINGVLYPVPAGCVTANTTGVFVNGASGANLAANTTYLVTLFVNSGTLTMDFKTTLTHAPSATAGNVGVEIWNSDDTRSVVGLIRANGSTQLADASTSRLVASWFNRQNKVLLGNSTNGGTATTSSYTEIASTARVDFVAWGDDALSTSVQGGMSNNTAGQTVYSNLGLDGTSITLMPTPTGVQAPSGSFGLGAAAIAATQPSEGYHYVTPVGLVTGGTGSYYVVVTGLMRI